MDKKLGGEKKVSQKQFEDSVRQINSERTRYRIKFLSVGPLSTQSVPGICDKVNEAIEIAETYVSMNPDSVAWVESTDGIVIKIVK